MAQESADTNWPNGCKLDGKETKGETTKDNGKRKDKEKDRKMNESV